MRVLVIRHAEIEHLGIFEYLLVEKGFKIFYLDTWKGELLKEPVESYSLIIVLGGQMGVYEAHLYPFLMQEFQIIAGAIQKRIPVLGICLGAQLIAKVLGGDVYRGKNGKEIGWCKVRKVADHFYFSDFPEELKVLQWHQDTFDLPKKAIRIFMSEKYLNQAFVYDKAVGIQFHIEITNEMLRKWAEVYRDELESEGISADVLRFENEKAYAELADSLLSKLLDQVH